MEFRKYLSRYEFRKYVDADAIDAVDALTEHFDESDDKRDLVMCLGGLIKAMDTNPQLIKAYIDRQIDMARDGMIEHRLCPECGAELHEGRDRRLCCENCASVYDGY